MNRMNTGLKCGSLIAVALVALSSCSTEQQAKVPSQETVRNIPVLAVQQANVPDLLEAVGNVGSSDFELISTSLRRLERFWIDQVRFQL